MPRTHEPSREQATSMSDEKAALCDSHTSTSACRKRHDRERTEASAGLLVPRRREKPAPACGQRFRRRRERATRPEFCYRVFGAAQRMPQARCRSRLLAELPPPQSPNMADESAASRDREHCRSERAGSPECLDAIAQAALGETAPRRAKQHSRRSHSLAWRPQRRRTARMPHPE
jgi:hypothetical protein